jgi:hypothetical protein
MGKGGTGELWNRIGIQPALIFLFVLKSSLHSNLFLLLSFPSIITTNKRKRRAKEEKYNLHGYTKDKQQQQDLFFFSFHIEKNEEEAEIKEE